MSWSIPRLASWYSISKLIENAQTTAGTDPKRFPPLDARTRDSWAEHSCLKLWGDAVNDSVDFREMSEHATAVVVELVRRTAWGKP